MTATPLRIFRFEPCCPAHSLIKATLFAPPHILELASQADGLYMSARLTDDPESVGIKFCAHRLAV